mmetsp:Transcript_8462/g.9941  ORF Transcript_8462/g.9941 Transcript_8462/m.9941 type:complete len:179 (+) Transcript_8462:46-582(+)
MMRSILFLIATAVLPQTAFGYTLINQMNIKPAVIEWAIDKPGTEAIYGPIGTWDTSHVTNMGYLFFEGRCPEGSTKNLCRDALIRFNENISQWDVSKVSVFTAMFWYCRYFNQDISVWDTESATDMSFMFWNAQSFNQPIGVWEVDNVHNMSNMFHMAKSFAQDLSGWQNVALVSGGR